MKLNKTFDFFTSKILGVIINSHLKSLVENYIIRLDRSKVHILT